MRSIKARFDRSKAENPLLGDYLHLAIAVRHQGFSKRRIAQAFNSLVPKDQYDSKESRQLLRYLTDLSKGSEEGNLSIENYFKKVLWSMDNETVTAGN